MSVEFESREPVFGDNYDVGYVGFCHKDNCFVHEGIAYATRWNRMSDIKVSHVLIVSGEDSCVEALVKGGVQEGNLKKYFDDPQWQISFRKPVGLTEAIAERIIAEAKTQLGDKYDFGIIVSAGVSGMFLGRALNRLLKNHPERTLARLLNSEDRWVCSELVAYALDQQDEYRDVGILNDPVETIDPQELFEDDEIFKPWHIKIG